MSILDQLGYDEGRILEVELAADKTSVNFMEACDLFFSKDLTKEELAQFISELQEIHGNMIST